MIHWLKADALESHRPTLESLIFLQAVCPGKLFKLLGLRLLIVNLEQSCNRPHRMVVRIKWNDADECLAKFLGNNDYSINTTTNTKTVRCGWPDGWNMKVHGNHLRDGGGCVFWYLAEILLPDWYTCSLADGCWLFMVTAAPSLENCPQLNRPLHCPPSPPPGGRPQPITDWLTWGTKDWPACLTVWPIILCLGDANQWLISTYPDLY